MAVLLLNAMTDWRTLNQTKISDFTREVKEYFGSPLTIQKITAKRFNGDNAWQIEVGSSIFELIHKSEKFATKVNLTTSLAFYLNIMSGSLHRLTLLPSSNTEQAKKVVDSQQHILDIDLK